MAIDVQYDHHTTDYLDEESKNKNCCVCRYFLPCSGETHNKMQPEGIIRSAVPLPCFLAVVKSQRVAAPIGPCVRPSAVQPRDLRACQRGVRAC